MDQCRGERLSVGSNCLVHQTGRHILTSRYTPSGEEKYLYALLLYSAFLIVVLVLAYFLVSIVSHRPEVVS